MSHGSVAENPNGPQKLTLREQAVLVLMVDGLTTREIAAHLGMRFKTAACHRSRILAKCGVRNTVLVLRYAIRAGLIQP